MNRLSITPGSQAGISALILLAELNTMEISVSTSDNQVIAPTVNSIRIMALLRMLELKPKKANQDMIGFAMIGIIQKIIQPQGAE